MFFSQTHMDSSIPTRNFHRCFGNDWCGAIFKEHWYQMKWSDWVLMMNPPVACLEVFPIYLACWNWVCSWFGIRMFFSDNAAVVDVWQKSFSKHKGLMELIGKFNSLAAVGNFAKKLYTSAKFKMVWRISYCGSKFKNLGTLSLSTSIFNA